MVCVGVRSTVVIQKTKHNTIRVEEKRKREFLLVFVKDACYRHFKNIHMYIIEFDHIGSGPPLVVRACDAYLHIAHNI